MNHSPGSGQTSRIKLFLQLVVNAIDFVLHGLFAVVACTHANGTADPWSTHIVELFVALLYRRHDIVPFTLDIGAISMQLMI